MKKTDGLGDSKLNVLWVMCRTNKLYSYEMFKGDLRTYISGCLPQERHTRPEQCTSNEMFANTCKTDYVWNTCLKSVREALGVDV